MKFARYLQDTQTPEWKKAYIDYRGLKVQLGIIRGQAPQPDDTSETLGTSDVDHTCRSAPTHEERLHDNSEEVHLNGGNATSARTGGPSASGAGPTTNGTTESSGHGSAPAIRQRTSNQDKPSLSVTLATLPPRLASAASTAASQQPLLPPRTRSLPTFPFSWDSRSPIPPPLNTILSKLPATHVKFLNMLDAELEKVESFYVEREKEMNERAKLLREQLNELGIHRQLFYQSSAHSEAQRWAKKAQFSVPSVLSSLMQWFPDTNTRPEEPDQIGRHDVLASESGRNGHRGIVGTFKLGTNATEHTLQSGDHSRSRGKERITKSEDETDQDSPSKGNAASSPSALDDSAGSPPTDIFLMVGGARHPLDPLGYPHAKRRLRKAVVEHYRGLEVLNNYRILNLIGFRKALKKYEKITITKNSVLDAYMKEKVEPSAFACGAMVSAMLNEMEDLFALRFEHGDRKKALARLRVGPLSKTHHFSTFRSGMWLGIALPAITAGSYLSFQQHTRESLPSWNVLLFIYSVLVLPVLLALLIGVNIAVWARERINYVFIFELNPRSRLDHHEYFELPSFLFCTLAYAFWFSLAQIGSPLLWPLIWLALVLVVMLNPIRNFMWGSARWWTVKNIAKLCASGIWKVEFTDFWLGDQFCSLVYSLSGMYFVGCFYTRFAANFPLLTEPTGVSEPLRSVSSPVDVITLYQSGSTFESLLPLAYDPGVQAAWSVCGAAQNWGWYFLLAVLPFMVRFVQSLRRYWDSKLPTHLINAGKYAMGMLYYFSYYYWKHQDQPRVGASYIFWCFTGFVYAIYACAWDFLMDWSMFKPHARYPLLRPELVYKSQIPSYYFALVSNLCVRFLWVIYIPIDVVPNLTIRTFIVAALEILRRVLWNFYRLENEHLGNIDQYRVTRELPLPYSFEAHSNEEEEHEEEHEEDAPAPGAPSSWLRRRRPARFGRDEGGG